MQETPQFAELNLFAGWCGFLAGVVSGAAMGLFFHREDWMGGYGSYRRRLVRLGHISFFGLGLINILFGLTLRSSHLADDRLFYASTGLLIGAVTMPACCFLTAWRKPFRHLFFIPVLSIFMGVAGMLMTWSHL
jgi:hypothetical protein